MATEEKTLEQVVQGEFERAKKDAQKVWDLVCSEIQEPEALLKYKGKPVLFKNTTIMIQGQTGTHKSRLAASLVSLLVAKNPELNLLGFTNASTDQPTIIYVDTERNINYNLPIAIRQILYESELDADTLRERLSILPLVNVGRQVRTHTMGKQFIELKGVDEKKHFVIFLDIVSDLISDFNNVYSSLELTDLLNTASNSFDLTFVVVLHENPGGEKARGHLGTELSNKASTILQVSKTQVNDVFKLKILKSRSTENYGELLLKFDATINNLRVVDDEKLALAASDPDMTKLCSILGDKVVKTIERQDLIKFLEGKLNWSERKIEDKLKKMVNLGIQFESMFGPAILTKSRGKTTEYEYILIEEEASKHNKEVSSNTAETV